LPKAQPIRTEFRENESNSGRGRGKGSKDPSPVVDTGGGRKTVWTTTHKNNSSAKGKIRKTNTLSFGRWGRAREGGQNFVLGDKGWGLFFWVSC